MAIQQDVLDAFEQQFGTPAEILVRSPGRVNLIGEHTDYNDGFVLPMAINRAIWIALHPIAGSEVKAYSLAFDETQSFDLTDLSHTDAGWIEYVKGVAAKLQEAGHQLAAWQGVIGSDIPMGAGLSSSAAIELATAQAFAAISDIPWQPKEMALLSQKAENEWVGMKSGIMDQMISAVGEADHALLIDCRSLDTRSVPLPKGTVVVVLDTSTRRGLVDSKYNQRREQCEQVASFFGVPALRDVSLEVFQAREHELEDLSRMRARHVITENARTLDAAEAMRVGDAAKLGELMNASHVSMRDDFEISIVELDTMVDCAQAQVGCFGARMTGGGFGGSAVALVEVDKVEQFVEQTKLCYEERTGLSASIYISEASGGTSFQLLS